MVISGSDGITFPDSTNQFSGGAFSFKNRIINGDMRIDQRNAGAAVTINTSASTYTLDRWAGLGQSTDGVFTVDQVTDAPTGFTNSAKITVTTADASIGATQVYRFTQFIEGFNCADLGFGSASAKTVTLSFWVRSSLTGTFGGHLANSGFSRAYPFTYSISSANTWEQKTVTIAGDTTGTWLTTNGVGIAVSFIIGMGSTFTGTANAWNAGLYFAPTGGTNIISTLNADIYITGVQLEVGSVATPFERRPYGTELALCQRYYYRWTPTSNGTDSISLAQAYVTNGALGIIPFPVPLRIRPTALEQSGTPSDYRVIYGNVSIAVATSGPSFSNASLFSGQVLFGTASVLTANSCVLFNSATVNGYLGWSAEL
jgi:hypothetical protein